MDPTPRSHLVIATLLEGKRRGMIWLIIPFLRHHWIWGGTCISYEWFCCRGYTLVGSALQIHLVPQPRRFTVQREVVTKDVYERRAAIRGCCPATPSPYCTLIYIHSTLTFQYGSWHILRVMACEMYNFWFQCDRNMSEGNILFAYSSTGHQYHTTVVTVPAFVIWETEVWQSFFGGYPIHATSVWRLWYYRDVAGDMVSSVRFSFHCGFAAFTTMCAMMDLVVERSCSHVSFTRTTKIDLVHTPIHHVTYRDILMNLHLTHWIWSLSEICSIIMSRESVARQSCKFYILICENERRVGIIVLLKSEMSQVRWHLTPPTWQEQKKYCPCTHQHAAKEVLTLCKPSRLDSWSETTKRYSKRVYRELPVSSKEADLERIVLAALESIPLDAIRR
jgi:hypothetical protein